MNSENIIHFQSDIFTPLLSPLNKSTFFTWHNNEFPVNNYQNYLTKCFFRMKKSFFTGILKRKFEIHRWNKNRVKIIDISHEKIFIRMKSIAFLNRTGSEHGWKSSGWTVRPGPAEMLRRAGPVMPNFISIRILERFFKENFNFIIDSFQIKHCSFKKMAEYRRNLRGILAKNGPAWSAEILGLNGPAQSN